MVVETCRKCRSTRRDVAPHQGAHVAAGKDTDPPQECAAES